MTIQEKAKKAYSEMLPKAKRIVDNAKSDWLQFHYDNAMKRNWEEMAKYTKGIAKTRGIELIG